MTWKTLQLSDYDDVVRMLHELMRKCNDVSLEYDCEENANSFKEYVNAWKNQLEYDIGLIIDKLEEAK